MINQIHVGLPVSDLTKSTEFYSNLGFHQNMNFSGKEMSQFHVTECIHLSLFAQNGFLKHISNPNVDKSKFSLVSSALSMSSKEAVDDIVKLALDSGASLFTEPNDNDFMYMNGFTDPDGHMWTVYFMKM